MATSPLYVPPEEARGEAITARGDIYSLGVFAIELLTVARLCPEMAFPRSGRRVLKCRRRLDDVIKRATADRPEHRYEQVEDFLRALRQAAGIDVVGAAEPIDRNDLVETPSQSL